MHEARETSLSWQDQKTRLENLIAQPRLCQHFLCLWIFMFTFCSCPHFSNYFEEAVPAPHLFLYLPNKQLHTVRLDSCPAQLHLLYCELKQNSFTCFCTRTLQGWFSYFLFCFFKFSISTHLLKNWNGSSRLSILQLRQTPYITLGCNSFKRHITY